VKLSSTLASDAADGHGVLDPILRAIRPGAVVAAPATTVRVTINDNLDVRHALQAGGFRGVSLPAVIPAKLGGAHI
jgi:hypothetical protein